MMRFVLGIALLAAVGSASAGVTDLLINGVFGGSGYGYSPFSTGGSILSIPSDIIQATRILFRSIRKILQGRFSEGFGDLVANGYNFMRNIYDDFIGRVHSTDLGCPYGSFYNSQTGQWECTPSSYRPGYGYGNNVYPSSGYSGESVIQYQDGYRTNGVKHNIRG